MLSEKSVSINISAMFWVEIYFHIPRACFQFILPFVLDAETDVIASWLCTRV
jgi:hypothetical protein